MEAGGLALGVVAAVVEIYKVVEGAYDLYLGVKDFPSTYEELRICLQIERYRLEQWGSQMLSDRQKEQAQTSRMDVKLWQLFHSIFKKIIEAFQDADRTMSTVGEATGISHQDDTASWDTIEDLSIDVKPRAKSGLKSLARSAKFVLRDRERMEKLLKKLCHWNDSLVKMTPHLAQESLRRQLRTHLATNHSWRLEQLVVAAAFLEHHDIESMATGRHMIQQGQSEEEMPPNGQSLARPASQYLLEMNDFAWQGIPYRTEQNRATAIYKGEWVIVDWRSCRDDTWRKENPAAFRLRTENLAKILNSDLRPLNLSVLHCVGYLDQGSHVTGYAFRPPPGTTVGQKPMSLYEILLKARKPELIPDLGERFKLAQALISTLFELHNLGWLHKNLNSKNILFWPRSSTDDEQDLNKPYIVGFDVARLNRPDEISEKPTSSMEDELYRHPAYKGDNPRSFLPSFDMYSIGIILFEIGMWRTVASQSRHRMPGPASPRPAIESHPSHPSNPKYIETVILGGSVKDLKRYMGARYRDAVITCLSQRLDVLWEDSGGDAQDKLRLHLSTVQNDILDPIASCSA